MPAAASSHLRTRRWLDVAGLLGFCLLVLAGCTAWRSPGGRPPATTDHQQGRCCSLAPAWAVTTAAAQKLCFPAPTTSCAEQPPSHAARAAPSPQTTSGGLGWLALVDTAVLVKSCLCLLALALALLRPGWYDRGLRTPLLLPYLLVPCILLPWRLLACQPPGPSAASPATVDGAGSLLTGWLARGGSAAPCPDTPTLQRYHRLLAYAPAVVWLQTFLHPLQPLALQAAVNAASWTCLTGSGAILRARWLAPAADSGSDPHWLLLGLELASSVTDWALLSGLLPLLARIWLQQLARRRQQQQRQQRQQQQQHGQGEGAGEAASRGDSLLGQAAAAVSATADGLGSSSVLGVNGSVTTPAAAAAAVFPGAGPQPGLLAGGLITAVTDTPPGAAASPSGSRSSIDSTGSSNGPSPAGGCTAAAPAAQAELQHHDSSSSMCSSRPPASTGSGAGAGAVGIPGIGVLSSQRCLQRASAPMGLASTASSSCSNNSSVSGCSVAQPLTPSAVLEMRSSRDLSLSPPTLQRPHPPALPAAASAAVMPAVHAALPVPCAATAPASRRPAQTSRHAALQPEPQAQLASNSRGSAPCPAESSSSAADAARSLSGLADAAAVTAGEAAGSQSRQEVESGARAAAGAPEGRSRSLYNSPLETVLISLKLQAGTSGGGSSVRAGGADSAAHGNAASLQLRAEIEQAVWSVIQTTHLHVVSVSVSSFPGCVHVVLSVGLSTAEDLLQLAEQAATAAAAGNDSDGAFAAAAAGSLAASFAAGGRTELVDYVDWSRVVQSLLDSRQQHCQQHEHQPGDAASLLPTARPVTPAAADEVGLQLTQLMVQDSSGCIRYSWEAPPPPAQPRQAAATAATAAAEQADGASPAGLAGTDGLQHGDDAPAQSAAAARLPEPWSPMSRTGSDNSLASTGTSGSRGPSAHPHGAVAAPQIGSGTGPRSSLEGSTHRILQRQQVSAAARGTALSCFCLPSDGPDVADAALPAVTAAAVRRQQPLLLPHLMLPAGLAAELAAQSAGLRVVITAPTAAGGGGSSAAAAAGELGAAPLVDVTFAAYATGHRQEQQVRSWPAAGKVPLVELLPADVCGPLLAKLLGRVLTVNLLVKPLPLPGACGNSSSISISITSSSSSSSSIPTAGGGGSSLGSAAAGAAIGSEWLLMQLPLLVLPAAACGELLELQRAMAAEAGSPEAGGRHFLQLVRDMATLMQGGVSDAADGMLRGQLLLSVTLFLASQGLEASAAALKKLSPAKAELPAAAAAAGSSSGQAAAADVAAALHSKSMDQARAEAAAAHAQAQTAQQTAAEAAAALSAAMDSLAVLAAATNAATQQAQRAEAAAAAAGRCAANVEARAQRQQALQVLGGAADDLGPGILGFARRFGEAHGAAAAAAVAGEAPVLPERVSVWDSVAGFRDERLEVQYRRLKALHLACVDRAALLLQLVRQAVYVWRIARMLRGAGSGLSLVLLFKYEAVIIFPYLMMMLCPAFWIQHRNLMLCLSQIAAGLTVGMITATEVYRREWSQLLLRPGQPQLLARPVMLAFWFWVIVPLLQLLTLPEQAVACVSQFVQGLLIIRVVLRNHSIPLFWLVVGLAAAGGVSYGLCLAADLLLRRLALAAAWRALRTQQRH